MEKFILSNEIINVKYYGLSYRLNVIFIDGKASIWIVTLRTANHQDEQTLSFTDINSAIIKFYELLKNKNYDQTLLEISNMIKEN